MFFERIFDFFRRNRFVILFSIIFFVGLFLRLYNFSPWLHFQLDQSRDAFVISKAYNEGIGNLPLLGPRAGGSFLRLGPIFYYFEYASTLVFGNTPQALGYVSLFFGVLAVLLSYFLFRRYFSRNISLSLMGVFSISFFLIMYSRFAWNPNPLPFFIMLTYYSLLRATDESEKKRILWFSVCAVALAIATQLHFLTAISLVFATVLFLFFRKPKTELKYWLLAILISVFFYVPVIINDIKTGGENIEQFFVAKDKKENKKGDHNIVENAIRNIRENSLGYFAIISGKTNAELPKLKRLEFFSVDVKCDDECEKFSNLFLGILSVIFFISGVFLLFWFFSKEKDDKKRDFLRFSVFQFVVIFVLFMPIAYDMSPRFFLAAMPLPILFLGFVMKFLIEKLGSTKEFFVLFFCVAFLLMTNGYEISRRFSEMRRAPYEPVHIDTDKVIKERYRVTLEQQNMIVDYVEKRHSKNNNPIVLKSEPFYERSLTYIIESRGIPRCSFLEEGYGSQGINYFVVIPTDSNVKNNLDDYLDRYDVVDLKKFGTLILFEIAPKKNKISDAGCHLTTYYEKLFWEPSEEDVNVRYEWDEIFE